MAATDKAAVATGADAGDALRRRNLALTQPTSAQIVQQEEDNKKIQKKVRMAGTTLTPTLTIGCAYELSNIMLTNLHR
jgi:hypothetical protein